MGGETESTLFIRVTRCANSSIAVSIELARSGSLSVCFFFFLIIRSLKLGCRITCLLLLVFTVGLWRIALAAPMKSIKPTDFPNKFTVGLGGARMVNWGCKGRSSIGRYRKMLIEQES